MANQNGEMYGKDRLLAVLSENKHASAAQIVEAIERDLSVFRCNAPVKDDVTFVVVRVS